MTQRETNGEADRHAGCKIFVAPSGLAGFVVGTEGERAGWLYDVFASPREVPGRIDQLVSLAVDQGARALVTYFDSLMAAYFEQFGFQAIARIAPNGERPDWLPDAFKAPDSKVACPDFLSMILIKPKAVVAAADLSPIGDTRTLRSPEACARCARQVLRTRHASGAFGGYKCESCGFLHVFGTLTMGPHRPATAPFDSLP